MVDTEYSMDTYKSVKISFETVMKNAEILRFVADHLKTGKMCKHAVKKLPMFLINKILNKCVITLF